MNLFSRAVNFLQRFFKIFNLSTIIFSRRRNLVKKIYHDGREFLFSIPNDLCEYRALSFSSKEPETLDWIDSIEPGTIFWDIGANVGLYSVYAAKKGCKVYAFEPSVFNLEVLARNSNLNDLTNLISIIPGALSDKTGFGTLNMTSTQIGGALSTFDKSYGYDGKALKTILLNRFLFRYSDRF